MADSTRAEPIGRPISVAANGLLFSGLEWGPADGRTVLLLHGFPQRCTSWTAIATRLAGAGLRAVALDQRGFSPGARSADVADYAMPLLVADAVAMIEALGAPVDLVGHDWGGVVGWQVAARRPELLRSWTAVSTPNPLALNEVLAVDEEQRKAFGYILIFREPGRAESALLGNDGAGLRAMYGTAVSPDRIDEDISFFAQPGVLSAALNWYRAMSPDDTAGVGRVQVPTTYVWGAADIAFQRVAAEHSGSFVDADYRFVPLEDVTHWVPDQAPDVLAAEILRRVAG